MCIVSRKPTPLYLNYVFSVYIQITTLLLNFIIINTHIIELCFIQLSTTIRKAKKINIYVQHFEIFYKSNLDCFLDRCNYYYPSKLLWSIIQKHYRRLSIWTLIIDPLRFICDWNILFSHSNSVNSLKHQFREILMKSQSRKNWNGVFFF